MSSHSWALSHQRAAVGDQAGLPAAKPLAGALSSSSPSLPSQSGTGLGRMWFLSYTLELHVG